MPKCSLLLLFAILLVTVAADDPPTLEKLFVFHRHGARTTVGIVDGRTNCYTPFCQLTRAGKEMCYNIGRHVMQTYNQSLLHFSDYQVSQMKSESTESPRVTVSAEAMVLGMFPESLPFVDFLPYDQDIRLSMWASWPTWLLYDNYDHAAREDEEYVVKLVGQDFINRFAKFYGLEKVCNNMPMDCINAAWDMVVANRSNGEIVVPFIGELESKMRTAMARFLSRLLGYNPKHSEYQKNVGSFGYPLATSIMEYFATKTEHKLYHVAAHDWTLFALNAALGIWTPENMDDSRYVPYFAETLIMELRKGPNGEEYVKAIRGIPQQGFDSQHLLETSEVGMRCLDKAGNVYRSNDTAHPYGCLLRDLWAYVNTTAPAPDGGVCYANDDIIGDADCDTDDAPLPGSRCLFYRSHCPGAACGPIAGALADPASNYACQSRQHAKEIPFIAATLVALIAPAVLGGAIFGFYIATPLYAMFTRKRKDEDGGDLGRSEDKLVH